MHLGHQNLEMSIDVLIIMVPIQNVKVIRALVMILSEALTSYVYNCLKPLSHIIWLRGSNLFYYIFSS